MSSLKRSARGNALLQGDLKMRKAEARQGNPEAQQDSVAGNRRLPTPGRQ